MDSRWLYIVAIAGGCAAGGDKSAATSSASGADTGGGGGQATTGTSNGGSGLGGANNGGANNGGSNSGGANNGGSGGNAAGAGGAGGMGAGGAGGAGGSGGGGAVDPPGTLMYERITNSNIVDDIRRVRWHPSGSFALLLGVGGKLVRYDVGGGLTLVDTLGVRADDLDVSEDGAFFAVVGIESDGAGRMWRVAVDVGLNLTVTEELTFAFGEPRAIERRNSTWAVGAYSTNSISYLYLWTDAAGIGVTKGFNASGGLTDLMWGDPLPVASEVVHTSHGDSGSDSQTYVVSSDMFVGNAWSAGFGNAGGAGWRPGGTYGYFTGSSTNKIYVYNGAWSSALLPGVGTSASPQSVAWNETGTRALIVGRAIGPGLSATVIDHRAGMSGAFSATDLVDQSIPDFDMMPWFGDTNVYLNAVDWRPGVCAEGLMVGDDNGTAQNPTFGLVVRFHDTADPDCL